jgi:hypothetical protein
LKRGQRLREQTAGVRKLFFQDIPGFFWLQKKWGIFKTKQKKSGFPALFSFQFSLK